MKTILRILALCLIVSGSAFGQCTTSQINWDNLEYYWNSGVNIAPYGTATGNYVTNAMEQTQKFAFGPIMATFATSVAGIVKGENGNHTGNLATFAGDDVQYAPTLGSTITITFSAAVSNLTFAIYDVDNGESYSLNAVNASNAGTNITATNMGSVTITTNNTATVGFNNLGGNINNTSTGNGIIKFSIAGPVKKLTLTTVLAGTAPEIYLSDLNGCVPGTFPTNYQQTGDNQPFTGPVTNQPDYFFVSPDNDSVYAVNPANGKAIFVFADPEKTYVNSMAYDMYNHIMYYISEVFPATATNKKLKKYDFTTGTISTVSTDITVDLNIPVFDASLESAGATFYDGYLYLGIEGGRHQASGPVYTTREAMIYRIDVDPVAGVVTDCAQVYGTPTYNSTGTGIIMDWADFIVKNGVLINFNSKGNSSSIFGYEHTDLMTGVQTRYNLAGVGQTGMDWAGNLYDYTAAGIAKYNENGTRTSFTAITMLNGGFWKGGPPGDAAENYRPMMDFGDAPASYDPVATSPAVNEIDPNLSIGPSVSKEWKSKGVSALADVDDDDALSFVTILNPSAPNYLIYVPVYNNTGANATAIAWIDFNKNGVFDASEGKSVTITPSASMQNAIFFWPNYTTTLTAGNNTYLRIRIAPATAGMTTSHATGYFGSGETEDYRVIVNAYPLAQKDIDMSAQITGAQTVKVNWSSLDDSQVGNYVVERSRDGKNWALVNVLAAQRNNTKSSYETADNSPLVGTSYYRLRVMSTNGKEYVSKIHKVEFDSEELSMTVAPNPARSQSAVYVNSASSTPLTASLEITDGKGMVVHSENVKLTRGNNKLQLPLDGKLSSGRYLVRVHVGSKLLTQTLIITK